MIDPAYAFAGLPLALRAELINSYREITRNFIERRWEPSELRGGKFAEIVYSIANGAVSGGYPAKASKPQNMAVACRALEGQPANPTLVGDKSLRVYIPRALMLLYDIRNNRGVGHVGGDVDPNNMDASAVVGIASWVMCELVRIFHNLSTEEAQRTVDSLVERKIPIIWEVEPGGAKRILDSAMSVKDQVLLLLHHSTGWVGVSDLQKWVEYKNSTNFRNNVLGSLHKARLIEFDGGSAKAKISPKGAVDVEHRLLKTRT
jgi:hypothetical protein